MYVFCYHISGEIKLCVLSDQIKHVRQLRFVHTADAAPRRNAPHSVWTLSQLIQRVPLLRRASLFFFIFAL